eukprot:TRINITY_DN11392_c0_g1_i1.p1 TRINITY_DN11392_c0_g1~~TRINITY_DN11392_c0_g1_i1.p1  ORF type:complete len:527 (-),score=75.10 TRINITY_DN11392_c0_g1_i1:76-1656(-)
MRSCWLLFISLVVIYADPNLVQTSNGPVLGYEQNGVRVWKGIPFASPPVGQNRFRPPQPANTWTQPLICHYEGNVCPQFDLDGLVMLGDEDCLNLDVWVPANATPSSNLPVLVWIYGGAWVLGDKFEFGLYDGTNKVNYGNYIHVAGNYRVGPVGFLGLNELLSESGTTGNYGLQDQTAVLQWVQKNIRAFGGDPTRVTINGESAGAFSVCWHLVNEASKGLFQAAILESGQCDVPFWWPTMSASNDWGHNYAGLIGCNSTGDVLTCLRNLPIKTIMGPSFLTTAPPNAPLLYPVFDWGATIDGTSVGLKGVPLDLIKQGKFNKVPVVIGTNQDEGDIFVALSPFIVPGAWLPFDQYRLNLVLEHFFGSNQTLIQQILTFYDQLPSYESMMSAAITDSQFVCPTRRLVRALSAQSVPAYLYRFTYNPGWADTGILGDYHTVELDFVFGNAWPPVVHSFNQADIAMSQTMMDYWISTIFNGNPNTNVPLKWPVYDNTYPILRFDQPLMVEYDFAADVCNFWDSVPNV